MTRDSFLGVILIKTHKAILFQSHYWHVPSWLPLSQCDVITSLDTEEVEVRVKSWLPRKSGYSETSEILEFDGDTAVCA